MKSSIIISSLIIVCSLNAAEGAGLLERYRGSPQETLLDQQIARYKSQAALNARVFGKDFKHLPGYDRHVGLEKLRKPLPRHVKKDVVPVYRLKAGLKPPAPKLIKFGKK